MRLTVLGDKVRTAVAVAVSNNRKYFAVVEEVVSELEGAAGGADAGRDATTPNTPGGDSTAAGGGGGGGGTPKSHASGRKSGAGDAKGSSAASGPLTHVVGVYALGSGKRVRGLALDAAVGQPTRVTALGFSENSRLLLTQCGEPDHMLLVWRWYLGKVRGGVSVCVYE